MAAKYIARYEVQISFVKFLANRCDSPHGDLVLNEDGLPWLQFEDADVCIKLGKQPNDWLLVHSEVLAATSPYFARAFSETWGKRKDVHHPVTGHIVRLKTRALKLVDDSYLLEGQVSAPRNVTLAG